MGSQAGLEWTTGYLIEKSLSVDNVFVFLIIFAAFKVPPEYQHRVLFWGVLGALVMRGVMIAIGAALLNNFEWVIYFFGALLVVTAVRLLRSSGGHPDVGHNALSASHRSTSTSRRGTRGSGSSCDGRERSS